MEKLTISRSSLAYLDRLAASGNRLGAAPFRHAGLGGSPGIALIRNDTGAALAMGDVVLLGEIIDTPDIRDDWHLPAYFKALKPGDPGTDNRPMAIVMAGIETGADGPCQVHGAARTRVRVEDADHAYARPRDGETGHLVSAESGPARLLYRQDGTGPGEAGEALILFPAGEGGGGEPLRLVWAVGAERADNTLPVRPIRLVQDDGSGAPNCEVYGETMHPFVLRLPPQGL